MGVESHPRKISKIKCASMVKSTTQMLMNILQNSSLKAAGFLSQKIKM
jgi:hypothetical protein